MSMSGFAFANKLGEKVSEIYNNPYDAYDSQQCQGIKKELCFVENNLVIRILDTKMISVKWAVLCAKHVLYIFEEQYPDNKRPRKSIEAVSNWIKDPSEKNIKICKKAFNDAANAAANAAVNAAANAAYAAAYASYTSYAFYDASYTSSYGAAKAVAAVAATKKSSEIKWQRKKLNQIVYEDIVIAFATTQYQRIDKKLVRKIPKELLEYIASFLY